MFVENRGKGNRGVDFAETRAIALDGQDLEEAAARGGRGGELMQNLGEEHCAANVVRLERDLLLTNSAQTNGDQQREELVHARQGFSGLLRLQRLPVAGLNGCLDALGV